MWNILNKIRWRTTKVFTPARNQLLMAKLSFSHQFPLSYCVRLKMPTEQVLCLSFFHSVNSISKCARKSFMYYYKQKKKLYPTSFYGVQIQLSKKAFKESEKIASLGAFCNFFTLKKFNIIMFHIKTIQRLLQLCVICHFMHKDISTVWNRKVGQNQKIKKIFEKGAKNSCLRFFSNLYYECL